MKVAIDRFGTSLERKISDLGYDVVRKPDPDMPQGQTRLARSGQEGKVLSVFKVRYKNNQEIGRSLVREEIKENPIDEIIYYGTMPPVISTKYGSISYHSGPITASNYYQTGDKLKITNLSNGKSVIVIVDSGCPHCGSDYTMMDLEFSAFSKLTGGNVGIGIISQSKIEHLAY
jgi:hypothetical protein